MESAKDSLLNEEARRKEKGQSSSGVLVHEKQERQEKPKRRGRSQSKNSHGFRGRSKSRKYIKCYHCNKVSHMRKECMIWKNEQNETTLALSNNWLTGGVPSSMQKLSKLERLYLQNTC